MQITENSDNTYGPGIANSCLSGFCLLLEAGMVVWNRRSFLKAAAGLPAFAALPRPLLAQQSASPGLVDVSLEAQQGWINIGGRGGYLYGFNGQVPGPVIEARPGDHVRVRFRNSLSEDTNLHYHGLHVSPSGNADNSFLEIPQGEDLTYDFDLPASHLGGTFWYHPHMHGSVARQVGRGLAGVFIVRGELDQIPEIGNAAESVLVLQDFDLTDSGLPIEPGLMERMLGREGGLVTANGQVNPRILIQRDGWIRLRILNASSSRFYRLRLEEHPLYLIAVDSGALPGPEALEEILVTPGERIEVMVRGARPDGSYRLLSLPYNRGGMGMGMMGGMGGSSSQTTVLATVVYEGQATRTWDLPQQLVRIDPLSSPTVRRSFQLGQGMGMGMGMMGGGGMNFSINGRTFSPNRVDTRVALGSVEEWEFINSMMMDHPMHVHTNPFQVIGSDGSPIRAWKDVVLVRANSRIRVRTAFREFTGKAMYHCHILDHEDLGMMGVLEIQG
jgi:FtsP/CotA-like multicopper oxidase with cupredoxin domain